MARLILDTGVLIGAAQGRLALGDLIAPSDDVTMPAIVVAEYLHGVLRAEQEARRTAWQQFLDDVLTLVPVEDYTLPVAARHAQLLAFTRTTGTPRGSHDLIIAATAAHTGRTILTTDAAARFEELPDVTATLVT